MLDMCFDRGQFWWDSKVIQQWRVWRGRDRFERERAMRL